MGRFLAILFVLAAVVVAAGFYLDWFEISQREAGNETEVALQVHKDKVRQDTDKLVDNVKEGTRKAADAAGKAGRKIKEGAQELVGNKTIKGVVMAVDAESGAVQLDTGADEPITIHTDAETKVRAGDQVKQLKDLSKGLRVEITYHDGEDGKRQADSIDIQQS